MRKGHEDYAKEHLWEDACHALCAENGERPPKVHVKATKSGAGGRNTIFTAKIGEEIVRSRGSRGEARRAAFAALYRQMTGSVYAPDN